ncbi:hypothetical protein PMIN02_012103 [Paraphaeosphaeria minitans]|uniref:Uncharacterized protein n=1 Tax=Paraphaeosphaeria minitans TaxID=565426 RepID=A0A9P6G4I3_9PLEO|nr:hypothetical protein PMIN01_13381 [Paraphaeosphaeria minitans]
MDGYVQTVTSLGVYSPQNLSPEILEQVLDSLKRETLKMEVVKLLLPVRAFPVSRAALQRISSLLKFMSTRAKQSDERVQTLRSLNCVSLIICGLCLTQKSVEGMKRELFDAFISQVIKTSQGSIHAILEDSEIRKAVLSSRTDQEFLQNYIRLQNSTHKSTPVRPRYSLSGNPSWCFSGIPHEGKAQVIFRGLLARAIGGQVTTFVPQEGNDDGLIRVVVSFDESMLQTLFGWRSQESLSTDRFSIGCAVKSQIAAEFGQDVFEAAESSNLWTQDTGEIETKCLKVDVYPGQFMVLGLAIGWTRCYEFMNSLYRS